MPHLCGSQMLRADGTGKLKSVQAALAANIALNSLENVEDGGY